VTRPPPMGNIRLVSDAAWGNMRHENILTVVGIILVSIFVAFVAWGVGWRFDSLAEEQTAAAHHGTHVLIGFGFISAGVVVLAVMLLRIVREWDRNRDGVGESESRFRKAFENAPIGIALIKPDRERILVNQALADFLGSSIDELTGTGIATTSGSNTDLDRSMEMRQEVIDGKRKPCANHGAISALIAKSPGAMCPDRWSAVVFCRPYRRYY
jgi:PAS domain-containing protein